MFSPPDPPRNVRIDDITRHEVLLSWKEPVFNGGADIISYDVEKKDSVGQRWLNVGKTDNQECQLRVKNASSRFLQKRNKS